MRSSRPAGKRLSHPDFGLTYIVADLEASRHLVAEAVERVGDGSVVAKLLPSVASAVAAVEGQGVAHEEGKQKDPSHREDGVHLGVCCVCSIIDDGVCSSVMLLWQVFWIDAVEREDSVACLNLYNHGWEKLALTFPPFNVWTSLPVGDKRPSHCHSCVHFVIFLPVMSCFILPDGRNPHSS